MAREKFVVRILSGSDDLLAWSEVYASPKPQERGASCPYWPEAPTKFLIEQDGTAAKISVHWCDLDVARVENLLEPLNVKAGQVATHTWLQPIWLVGGMRNVPLPAVTVRAPVTIAVPVGSLNAIAGGV